MSNRLIAFIIAIVLATLSAFAQEITQETPATVVTEQILATPAQTAELIVPTPPVMEEPKATEEIATATQEGAQATNGVNIGLTAQVRQKEASLLNALLADEFVLYTKTLKFHWNVQGIVFHDFHALFKEQYEKLFDFVDDIAERARALGAPALGSLQEFSTFTRLKEITAEKLTAVQMINALLLDHEAIIRTLRAAIDTTAQLGDQGTSNFLQDLIVKHEKIAWMLRATLQK